MKIVKRTGDEGQNFEEITTDTQDSVEMTMDSKGKYKPTIKIYFSPELPATAVAESVRHLHDALLAAFPGRIVEAKEE